MAAHTIIYRLCTGIVAVLGCGAFLVVACVCVFCSASGWYRRWRGTRQASRRTDPARQAARQRHPGAVPGRPVDGDVLTADEEDSLAAAHYLLTRYPLVSEPHRPARRHQ